ncbi:hypothetical protein TPA0598_04_00710 [Streptomyces lydicamycinicus]|uniref:Uncharacterized protein n=1 Tax=Streptomyces lydicamycinicus TaxID=1546107 RepID=A0A0N7YLC6_9ACTN|nr:hypothetical protein [Streptomyces lydicamycinicus]GAO08435.1 hypothetical protein TPA0598_04_00710 [Streptomyces lydicamycinicus]
MATDSGRAGHLPACAPAAYSQAAETAVEPTRTWLLETADDHQAMADAARLGDYHYTDLED